MCHGVDLHQMDPEAAIAQGINLEYVIDAYHNLNMGEKFFTRFFDLLMGRRDVKQMIMDGKSAAQIKASWAADVAAFKQQRQPYLIYQSSN